MRIAILGSGRGSNAEALLRAQESGNLGRTRIIGIFCDQSSAGILRLGPRYGCPARYLDPGSFRTRFAMENERIWVDELQTAGAEWLVLAGFMRVLKEPLLEAFSGRILNLHPSLLPSFPGLDAIGQAWNKGVAVSGCTVHLVDASLDGGAILDQAAVRREPDDSYEDFAARIHEAEHWLLPDVLRRISLRPDSQPLTFPFLEGPGGT